MPYDRELPGEMPAKSRFTRLDAFAKTVEDARIRTNSGGIITIVSLLVVLWLVWGEWADYRRVVVKPELIVDKSRGTHSKFNQHNICPRRTFILTYLEWFKQEKGWKFI